MTREDPSGYSRSFTVKENTIVVEETERTFTYDPEKKTLTDDKGVVYVRASGTVYFIVDVDMESGKPVCTDITETLPEGDYVFVDFENDTVISAEETQNYRIVGVMPSSLAGM